MTNTNRWWADCSALPSPRSAVRAVSISWTATWSSSSPAPRRMPPSPGCRRISRAARHAPRTMRACAPCSRSGASPADPPSSLLEGDDLLDAAGPVRVAHRDQRQRAEVDLLGRGTGAPGGGIVSLLRSELVVGCLDRGPDLRPAVVDMALAAVAPVELVG